ncbi:MAG: thioredoxin domain-containing protein [SAR324 cluster bacterium]|nr:thioredoxin domain-containing protein [SAR324 cluster bacterium]
MTSYSNRLIHEKSPYLLQHSHNPVDWFPWGPEAFDKARLEQKPLLISIGYATCHWCHVMERESFENPQVAQFMNEHFVAIKVDREERPDVDKIYMDALHAFQQQGGWPLNMFATSEGMPFTGGTYFPPKDSYGRKSFLSVLEYIHQIWSNDRDQIYQSAQSITAFLQQNAQLKSTPLQDAEEIPEKTFKTFLRAFDREDGGFQFQANNKFPPSMGLMTLLRYHQRTHHPDALEMVETTLHKMLAGGIYDQLGGGLSRYSTDYQWMVPHFEKMLYDNALFVWSLLETWQVTRHDSYRERAEDVLTYIERDMRSPEGAFYSAEDADSEGVEGKFYVWSQQEFRNLLGAELSPQAEAWWGITPQGNFEHQLNIPHRPVPEEAMLQKFSISRDTLRENMRKARAVLLESRSRRPRPLLDDKILVSWNGLMISAFARASRIFENENYAQIARQAAEFIFSNMFDTEGRLLRRHREGEGRFHAYLCDHTHLAMACLDLYETTYESQWVFRAKALMDQVNTLFRNEEGPYYDTGHDAETVICRSMEGYDGVEPSGNSMAALVFLKLHYLGFEGTYREDSLRILEGFQQHLHQGGASFAAMQWALDWHLFPPTQVVILGNRHDPEIQAMLSHIRQEFYPAIIPAYLDPTFAPDLKLVLPVFEERVTETQLSSAWLCRDQMCGLPIHLAEELKIQLET